MVKVCRKLLMKVYLAFLASVACQVLLKAVAANSEISATGIALIP
jgi:hypothetical protein